MTRTALLLTLALAPITFAPIGTQTPRQQDHMSSGMAMHEDAKSPIAPSTGVTVTFQGTSVTLSVEDLFKLPQQTITALDGHTGKTETFSGPLVADVLAKAGLVGSDQTHKIILHSTVVATGTDGYFVLYSAAELEPRFTANKVIVALMQSGLPLPSHIQLVNPADTKPARWVHGLSALSVMTLDRSK
jgi:hypothetical protein